MTLSREEVVAGFADELVRFSELVRSIDAKDWKSPSRCDGWTAADVASHVTGQLSDIVNGRFDGLGTPEVTEREVDEVPVAGGGGRRVEGDAITFVLVASGRKEASALGLDPTVNVYA